jgi:uncharacterized protein
MTRKWCCVENCGACCHLDPGDRPELEDYLTADQLQKYLSLVGEDGWCINFDHDTRKCSIYEDRPSFCRVTPENFEQMYGIESREFNEFAIECCQEQITGVYGDKSPEMLQYDEKINHLETP